MNIIEQNKEKINGILETFDRMIINGYSLNLCNYRHFLYYLIHCLSFANGRSIYYLASHVWYECFWHTDSLWCLVVLNDGSHDAG